MLFLRFVQSDDNDDSENDSDSDNNSDDNDDDDDDDDDENDDENDDSSTESPRPKKRRRLSTDASDTAAGCTLFVRNLPFEVEEADLVSLFRDFGKVHYVKLCRKRDRPDHFTGTAFVGLSAYAINSKKDFSFMGQFLMVGILVAFVAGIGSLVASLMGYHIQPLALAVSGAFAVLMCGMILWQTSAIIHGGETNYILATIGLYVAIYNMFTSLLHLLGFAAGED